MYNQTAVANGGTGRASVTSGNLLIGAGTSAMTLLAGAATNDVVTWNGTAWISQVGAGGAAPVVTIYSSPATWSKPSTVKAVKVSVLSGGGGGGGYRGLNPGTPAGAGGGGAGGYGYFPAASIPGPVSVSVGSGGAGGPAPGTPISVTNGTPGGSSSFGAFITATGGAANSGISGGLSGSITPSPTVIGFIGTRGDSGPLGNGGNAFQLWGFGGAKGPVSANPGTGYGAGGGGTGSPAGASAGGNGTTGFVIVEEFY